MIIGFMSLDLYLPGSHSLKDKRKRLKSLKDRIKTRYNVAFSEIDYQDKWQRSRIGLVSLNNQKLVVEKMFNRILKDIEENLDGEITQRHIEYL